MIAKIGHGRLQPRKIDLNFNQLQTVSWPKNGRLSRW